MSHPRFARRSVVCCALVLGAAPAAQAVQTSGAAALLTDYVWRGSTQTQGDPAVQASFQLAGDTGFYAQVWGSNVEFAPEVHASSELDVTVGWAGALGDDLALDANLTHYRYPSTRVALDWTEALVTATWRNTGWLTVGYSDDALATGEDGVYAQFGAKLPLRDRLRLEGAVGQYWLRDAYGDNYAHAQLGLVWGVRAPLELRLTAHATDNAAERLFPGLAGSRVEAALQASF